VTWAGAAPAFNAVLLPSADTEPLAAFLLQLGAGDWAAQSQQQQQQQQQQQHDEPDVTQPAGRQVISPADLRAYCGRSFAADEEGLTTVRCCFLSGCQCCGCAAATATLSASGLEEQLQACGASLQGLRVLSEPQQQQQQPQGEERQAGSSWALQPGQFDELLSATRLFHLQQPGWYQPYGGSSSSECQQQQTDAADAAQLRQLQAQLRPLRDVVALREVHLEQQDGGSYVWPIGFFDEMAEDALAVAQRQLSRQARQTEQVVQQLRRLTTTPGGTGQPPVSLPDEDEGGEGGDEDEDEVELGVGALDVLQAATEDFIVQQLAAANELALHAGRQEVQPQDLRLALQLSGYGSYVQQSAVSAASTAGRHSGARAGSSASAMLLGRRQQG
jgi:hypothetical protein